MDIYKTWQSIDQIEDSAINKQDIMKAIHKESKSVVGELKKRLKHKMNYCLFFIFLFTIGMIWSFGNSQLILLFGIVNAVYIFGYFMLRKEYLKMDANISFDRDLLRTLRSNKLNINTALKSEQNIFILALPLLFMVFTLLKPVADGFTIMEALNTPFYLKKALLFTVFGLPFVYFMGKKMNDIAYGPFQRKLDDNLRNLESI